MLSDDVKRRLETLLNRPGRHLLGITGTPGAGKSTLAARLVEHVGQESVLIPMDGFHLANRQLRRLQRTHRKGAPDTFDVTGYVALLKRLREPEEGETIYAPQFHREMEESIAGEIEVERRVRLVVTEGNYLLMESGGWEAVRGLLTETWYVDVEAAVRWNRLVKRHQQFGRSREEAEQWVWQTDEVNAGSVEETRGLAQFVIELKDAIERLI